MTKQDPIAVANLIIQTAIDNKQEMTNLYLQKIMFFMQGYYLVHHHDKLFNADFVKWDWGPSILKIYDLFRSNGASPITEIYRNAYFEKNRFVIKDIKLKDLSKRQKTELIKLIKQLLLIRPWQMLAEFKNIKADKQNYTVNEIKYYYQKLQQDYDLSLEEHDRL